MEREREREGEMGGEAHLRYRELIKSHADLQMF